MSERCEHCHGEIPRAAPRCPHCGQRVAPRVPGQESGPELPPAGGKTSWLISVLVVGCGVPFLLAMGIMGAYILTVLMRKLGP